MQVRRMLPVEPVFYLLDLNQYSNKMCVSTPVYIKYILCV